MFSVISRRLIGRVRSYPSAEMQSMYSAAPADRYTSMYKKHIAFNEPLIVFKVKKNFLKSQLLLDFIR